jgi:hypothetical protein
VAEIPKENRSVILPGEAFAYPKRGSSKKPRKHYGDLRRLIQEALDMVLSQRQKLPPGVVNSNVGSGWPHMHEDYVPVKEPAFLKTVEESQKEIMWRLMKFKYPYPEGNKKGKTFYEHVRDEEVVDVLLNPPLLWTIRMVWYLQIAHTAEVKRKKKGASQYGHPVEFHRKMMHELSGHLAEIATASKEHHVPKDWLKGYREAVLKQILREASVVYPRLQWDFTPVSKITLYSSAVEEEVELFRAMKKEFAKKSVKNDRLACQLTSLLSSPAELVRAGKLDPTPDTVWRNVRDRRKKEEKTR